jgi:hypothetical protein
MGQWFMLLAKEQAKGRGESLDFERYSCEAAPPIAILQRFGGDMTIEDFRKVHCGQTRVVGWANSLRLYPLGFNIFTIPRDQCDMFVPASQVRAREEPNSVSRVLSTTPNKVKPAAKKRKAAAKKSAEPKKRKCAASVPVAPKRQRDINQLLQDQRKPENRIRSDSVSFHMSRPETVRPESNIGNLMGIKFK